MVVSRLLLSIPGGRLMLILIPWKPVVVVWCLLAAMLWIGYVSSSVLEGRNPFAIELNNSHRPHPHSTADQGRHNKRPTY